MIQKIKNALGLTSVDPREGRTIIVNSETLERRTALLEDGVLEEYNVERNGDDNIVGGIFKGRVKNIEQGLKAMFVDIGLDKNAFLHFWDAIPAALDGGLEEIRREGRPQKKQKKITSKDIPSIYPVGSEIMIQVSKGAIGNKGPRVTTNISLAGRYLVLMPYSDQFGISRRIDDPKERQRLRKIMQRLSIPDGMGIIMRTVATSTRARHFVRDLAMLLEQWEQVEDIRNNKSAPACCFREPDLVEGTATNFLTDEVDKIICDDEKTTAHIREIAAKVSRRAKRKIHYLYSKQTIFERFGIQKQIDEAFMRQVWLPCGGYIVIDETEALISVDVNTGRNRGSKDVDKILLQTNNERIYRRSFTAEYYVFDIKTKNLILREQYYSNINKSGGIVFYKKCIDCSLIEKLCHHMLDKFRENKMQEWFNVGLDFAKQTVSAIIAFSDSKNIESLIPAMNTIINTTNNETKITNENEIHVKVLH